MYNLTKCAARASADRVVKRLALFVRCSAKLLC